MKRRDRNSPAPKRTGGMPDARFFLLTLIFFVSGTCGLVYEVVFARLLVLVFGSTTYAVSTVLGVFMFGLAAGSWLCGARAGKVKDPLQGYAILEIGIGVLALLFLPLLSLVQDLHSVAFRSFHDAPLLLNGARVLLCFGLLVVPTMLMGATVPLFSRVAVRSTASAGFDIGFLYAVNTFGAALGCFGGAFLLIPAFGLSVTILVAAGTNILIGAACFWAARKGVFKVEPREDRRTTGRKAPKTSPPSAPLGAPEGNFVRTALFCFFLTGMLSLAYQVAWTRALLLIFGSSVYAFATMLTTFLFGLATGSLVAGRLADRVRNRVALLVGLQVTIGISVLAATPVLGRLPDLFLAYFKEEMYWGKLVLSEFFICFLVMFIPTFCSGALFPLVARIFLDARSADVGRSVGNVYFVNTIGGIIGSLAAGFLLVPALGAEKTLLYGSLAGVLVGYIAYFGYHRMRLKSGVIAAASLALIAGAGLFALPRWNPLVMNSGVYIYGTHLARKAQSLGAYMSDFELLYYREDESATVAVLEGNERFLRINGKTDGGTGDNHTQILLGVLPSLYARNPETALVIGLGTGVTAGSVLDFDTFRSVDVIEISPAVVEASSYFDDISGSPLQSPKTTLHTFDGRTWIMAEPKLYDVIVSEPSHPWQTGNANLFTVDFFEMARKRLVPNGVFCQWLPYYHMDSEHFRILLNSYKKVFPYVNVWVASTDALLIGANEKPLLDYSGLQKVLGEEKVKRRLREIDIRSVDDLLSFFWLDNDGVERFISGVEAVNSDNHPVIEFSAPKYLLTQQTPETFFALLDNSYASRLSFTDPVDMEVIEASRIKKRGRFLSRWHIPDHVITNMLRKYDL